MLMIPFLPPDLIAARWVFLSVISLIRSVLCSSSFNLSLLTSYCANFNLRGNLPVTDVTEIQFVQQGAFLLWQTKHIRASCIASREEFPMSIWDIAFSNGSNRLEPLACGWDRANSANLAMSLIQLFTFSLTYSFKYFLEPIVALRCFCPWNVHF